MKTESQRAYMREYAKRHGQTEAGKKSYERAYLKYEYGITVQQRDGMIAKQNGRCAICHEPGKLHIDHDHATGRLRGMLCGSCNRAIGLLKDNPERMRSAAYYVERADA